jgi:hypothetical protein
MEDEGRRHAIADPAVHIFLQRAWQDPVHPGKVTNLLHLMMVFAMPDVGPSSGD